LFNGPFGCSECFSGFFRGEPFDGYEYECGAIEWLKGIEERIEFAEGDAGFGVYEAIETRFMRFVGLFFAAFA
jgi:hypothetical protein